MNAQAIPLRIYHIDLNLERYRFRFYLSLLDPGSRPGVIMP